jgi:hypothetical protein
MSEGLSPLVSGWYRESREFSFAPSWYRESLIYYCIIFLIHGYLSPFDNIETKVIL